MQVLSEISAAMSGTRESAMQLVKYGLVGVLNTLVTLGTILVCKSFLGVNEYVSNALGYVLGVLNSFVWNKRWVFGAKGDVRRQMLLFFIGFGLCYCVNFSIVWALTQSSFGEVEYDLGFFVISGYGIATLIGNVAYTLCNFIYNKTIAFSK